MDTIVASVVARNKVNAAPICAKIKRVVERPKPPLGRALEFCDSLSEDSVATGDDEALSMHLISQRIFGGAEIHKGDMIAPRRREEGAASSQFDGGVVSCACIRGDGLLCKFWFVKDLDLCVRD